MAVHAKQMRDAVLDALRRIMVNPGEDEINDDDHPIGDLGLASVDGVDFVLEIEDELGVHIPDDVNPFVDDSRQRARTVGEIIRWAEQLSVGQEEGKHA